MGLVKHYLKQADYICFILSIILLPLSIKLSSKLLFIAILLGVIQSIYTRAFSWFLYQKPVIVLNALFVIYIIIQGLILDGPTDFFKTFDRAYAPYLVFLLMPIFYNKCQITKHVPLALLIGVCTLCFLILVNSFLDGAFYTREMVLEVFDMHHLYISLYILFLINFLLSTETQFKVKSKVILIFILVCFLIFFKSKAAIVATVILLLYHAAIRLKLNKTKWVGLGVAAVILIVIFNTYFHKLFTDALDFRSRIWAVAIEYILHNPIFGYGSNNEHAILNRGHFLIGNYDFLDSNLNTHNQFLTFLLKFGLVGFVLVLSPFVYIVMKVNKPLRQEYLGFLILLFCMSFIESLYNRHHGIVFICLTLYYYHNLSMKAQKN
ncbi:O-antigen ligase family protein [Aestuariivivens sediminis]|uniref:O-antigen ligase family protein n=1 Tax=Aestuariivivens sediminis TaxID=2913557 RepID=UPI001F5A3003|nr:O-antigen ligase family protein [Aestuariivivens sediminis]